MKHNYKMFYCENQKESFRRVRVDANWIKLNQDKSSMTGFSNYSDEGWVSITEFLD